MAFLPGAAFRTTALGELAALVFLDAAVARDGSDHAQVLGRADQA